MRLKAEFRDPVTFLRIMQTMAKLSPKCLLRFSPDEVVIVVPRGSDSLEAWVVLDDMSHFFRDYKAESNFNNQINLEVSTEMLCQALKLTTTPSEVIMRLAKRGAHPTLNFELKTRSLGGQDVTVLHEVLIVVKKPREVADIRSLDEVMQEREDQYRVSCSFPDFGEVRVVAERMKTLIPAHDRITITANRAGQLRVGVQGDEVKIETQWQGLDTVDQEGPRMQDGLDSSVSEVVRNRRKEALKRFHNIRLEARTFLKVLACPLADFDAQFAMVPKTCATFLLHVRAAGVQDRNRFVALITIHLPGLLGTYDDDL